MKYFLKTYEVRYGDDIFGLARQAGFDNPGPIVAFPPNSMRFQPEPMAGPQLGLTPEELLQVPWTKSELQTAIDAWGKLIKLYQDSSTGIINEDANAKADLESYLLVIDMVNFAASSVVGIVLLGPKAVAAMAKGSAGMKLEDIMIWLKEFAASRAGAVIPAPFSVYAPTRDFSYWVRHATGALNPSYWASIYAAIAEGDADIYQFGADAVHYKTAIRVRERVEKDIVLIKERMVHAYRQMRQPFYNHFIDSF